MGSVQVRATRLGTNSARARSVSPASAPHSQPAPPHGARPSPCCGPGNRTQPLATSRTTPHSLLPGSSTRLPYIIFVIVAVYCTNNYSEVKLTAIHHNHNKKSVCLFVRLVVGLEVCQLLMQAKLSKIKLMVGTQPKTHLHRGQPVE
jgi:hypothetical protein